MIARSDARSLYERSEIRDDREIPANRVRRLISRVTPLRPLVAVGVLPVNGRCSNEQTRMSLRSYGLRLLSVVVELE